MYSLLSPLPRMEMCDGGVEFKRSWFSCGIGGISGDFLPFYVNWKLAEHLLLHS